MNQEEFLTTLKGVYQKVKWDWLNKAVIADVRHVFCEETGLNKEEFDKLLWTLHMDHWEPTGLQVRFVIGSPIGVRSPEYYTTPHGNRYYYMVLKTW